tara:strand:- start:276 stop:473 length:198 start_codon:yes stop_codon:yes gene_type:complete
MTAKDLTNANLENLRSTGLITENEIAFIEGDILLAKDVVTEKRRIIGKANDILSESSGNKRILKG